MSSELFAKAILCKKYNYEEDSIESILSQIEVDDDMRSSFYLYISAKIVNDIECVDSNRIFVFIKNKDRIRELGNFEIPDDPKEKEVGVFEYRIIYDMAGFSFPDTGEFSMELYSIKNQNYQELLKNNYKEQPSSVYSLITENDGKLLDKTVFEVNKVDK